MRLPNISPLNSVFTSVNDRGNVLKYRIEEEATIWNGGYPLRRIQRSYIATPVWRILPRVYKIHSLFMQWCWWSGLCPAANMIGMPLNFLCNIQTRFYDNLMEPGPLFKSVEGWKLLELVVFYSVRQRDRSNAKNSREQHISNQVYHHRHQPIGVLSEAQQKRPLPMWIAVESCSRNRDMI